MPCSIYWLYLDKEHLLWDYGQDICFSVKLMTSFNYPALKEKKRSQINININTERDKLEDSPVSVE